MTAPLPALARLNELSQEISGRLLRDLPSNVARIEAAKAAVEQAEEATRYVGTEAGSLEYALREVRKQWRKGWQTAIRAALRSGRFAVLLAAFHFWSRAEYGLAIVAALAFISWEYEQRRSITREMKEIAVAAAARVAADDEDARVELNGRIEDLVILTTAIANEHDAMLKALAQPTVPKPG
jgi:hypothetical protein